MKRYHSSGKKLTYFLLPFLSSLKLYVAGDLAIPNCLQKDAYSVFISHFSKQTPTSSLKKMVHNKLFKINNCLFWLGIEWPFFKSALWYFSGYGGCSKYPPSL